MKKTITVVLDIEADEGIDIECDDDLQSIFNDSNISSYGGTDSLTIEVTNFAEGDKLNVKPEHFSDRELAERGLPLIAFSLDSSTGAVIFLERGMMGFFPSPEIDPTVVDYLNETMGVTKAQANAMHNGSMFGWHCGAADPKASINQEG